VRGLHALVINILDLIATVPRSSVIVRSREAFLRAWTARQMPKTRTTTPPLMNQTPAGVVTLTRVNRLRLS